MPDDAAVILVHDAARPVLPEDVVGRLLDALGEGFDGAVPGLPLADTVKRVEAGGAVSETLDRKELWAVQTPQVFRRAALERALEVSSEQLARATDDAWLIERAGGRVIVVGASPENLKVTTPFDLRVAELLLEQRARRGS